MKRLTKRTWFAILVAIFWVAVVVGGCGSPPPVAEKSAPAALAAAFLPGFVVETGDLAGMSGQANVVLLDARTPDLYKEAHIANAVNVSRADLRDADTAATTGFPITAEKAAKIFGEVGIDANTRVVVYDAGDGRDVTGAWFVLRFFGHENVQVLNGGLRKWVEEKRPVTTAAGKAEKKNFAPKPQADWVATADWISKNGGKALLLDARSFNEYVGLDLLDNPRGGHLPGAVLLEWKQLGGTIEKGELVTFKSAAEMQKVLQEKGVTKDKEIVTYCQVGLIRASVDYMALRMLGYDKVRLYVGSFEDWSRRLDLPVETKGK
jgi:thiosulfate/3-mercaptopyruvate sulfurtransferase